LIPLKEENLQAVDLSQWLLDDPEFSNELHQSPHGLFEGTG